MPLMAVIRHPVFLVWLLMFLLAGAYTAWQTRLVTDMSQFLPTGASPLQTVLLEQVRTGAASRLLLLGLDGAPAEQLAAASKHLRGKLEASAHFDLVQNGVEDLAPDAQPVLFRYRYLLNPAVQADYFSVDNLRAALQRQLRILTSSFVQLKQNDVRGDPGSAYLGYLLGLRPQGGPQLSHGVWFGIDGSEALLLARTQAPAFSLEAQQQVMAYLQDLMQQDEMLRPLRLQISGPALFAQQAKSIIAGEVSRISIVTTVVMLLFLALVLRNSTLVFCSALPLLSGILAAVAVVTFVYGSIHGITLAFGVTLVGVAVDYPIHLFAHKRAAESASASLRRIWPTLRLGLITTAMGYLAMLFSDFTGLAQLGVFAIAGLTVAVAVTRWVMPLLVADSWEARWRMPGLKQLTRNYWPLSSGLWLLTAFALWYVLAHGNIWEDDIAALNPEQKTQKVLDSHLRQQLGAPDTRHFLLVQAESEEALLLRCEQLQPKLDAMVDAGVFSHFELISRYLPSAANQRQRQQELPDARRLQQALTEASAGLPFKPGTFEPFVAAVQASRDLPPLNLATFAATPLGRQLSNLVFDYQGQWFSLVPLTQIKDYTALAKDFPPLANDAPVMLLDLKAQSNTLMSHYRDRALWLFALGAGGILLVLVLGLRSFPGALRVFMPVVGSLLVTVMVLLLAGERLSLFHLASLLLVIGIGLDYSLFFQRYQGNAVERNQTLWALVVCAMTTILVFGILAGATTPVLHAIGLTVCVGTLFSFAYAVFGAPASSPSVHQI